MIAAASAGKEITRHCDRLLGIAIAAAARGVIPQLHHRVIDRLSGLPLLPHIVDRAEKVVRAILGARPCFLIEVGDKGYLIKIIEGRVVSVTPGPFVTPNYSFALRAPKDEWETFWTRLPPPGHHDIFALFKRGKLVIEGDLHPFMSNLLYIKDVVAAPRREARQ